MKIKKSYAVWNKKERVWSAIRPHDLHKKFPIPCPRCKYHLKKKSIFHLFKKNKSLGVSFEIYFNLENDFIELKNWVCEHCGNKLDFNTFPQEIKNFFNNLYLRDLMTVYLKPSLLIVEIDSGKEFSGEILETGATYKTDQRSVKLICGNCKNKNQFQIVKSAKNHNTYQCLKCGKINVLHSDLFDYKNIPTK
ncbi:MAG: hypothetical protein ACFFAN_19905 [Promethearchaeota archaeon]